MNNDNNEKPATDIDSFHRLVRKYNRVDSEKGKITKYEPEHEPQTPEDFAVALDVVSQVVNAAAANFQNTSEDLARLITDRFTLRS